MKKIFTLCALAAMTLPVATSAQNHTKYRLTDMEDFIWGETMEFNYDEAGNLTSYDVSTDVKVRFVYEYDSKNQCVKETIFHDVDRTGVETESSYIDYTYDENGRMATRTNYANFNPAGIAPNFEVQATIYYTYDENGRLILSEMYRGLEKIECVQKSDYTYNDDGNLLREDHLFLVNGKESSRSQVQYVYNEDGRLAEKCNLSPNQEGVLMPENYTIYVYGNDGIVEEVYTTGSGKNPDFKMSSSVYSVDEAIPASEVVYPLIPEPFYDNEIWSRQPVMILSVKEYIRADNEDFVEDHDWTYNYEDFTDGIVNMGVAGRSLASAVVIGDELRLLGVSHATNVYITDLNGRVVKSFTDAGNIINVADLAKGVYVVSSREGTAKFVR